jgi:peptidoglycan/LPS O-acetylase OafA/YrhL
MSSKKQITKPSKTIDMKVAKPLMVFKKQNYMLLAISFIIVVIGFIVMGSGKGQAFDAPIKITVAPLIVLAGFALGVFSILYNPKSETPSREE